MENEDWYLGIDRGFPLLFSLYDVHKILNTTPGLHFTGFF
jgi:hypothetical protein